MIRPIGTDDVNALAEAMRASYAEEPWHEQWTQQRATCRMKRFYQRTGLVRDSGSVLYKRLEPRAVE